MVLNLFFIFHFNLFNLMLEDVEWGEILVVVKFSYLKFKDIK